MRFELDRFFVKICGVTSEEDALLCLGLGASAIGFIFAPSPRQVQPHDVHEIIKRLPPESITVGVFRNERPETVAEVANTIGLTAVQLHGNETRGTVDYVRERVRTVIRALPASSDHVDVADSMGLDYLMIDSDSPGSGVAHDFSVFRRRKFLTPVIAAGGLNPDNVVAVARDLPVWGVDAASGVERALGVKDPIKVAEFIENARWAYGVRSGPSEPPFDWSQP
jgi:phosphoribosylanthranilate isomerase